MYDDLLKQAQRYMPHGPAPKNWEGALIPNSPWVVMFWDKNGENIYFVNQETFKPYLGNGWEFWVKIIFLSDKSEYSDSKMLFQIRCDKKTLRIISSVDYDRNGNPVSSGTEDSYASNNLEPIVPDTIGDGLYQAVCR
jgi:hypothetical protein